MSISFTALDLDFSVLKSTLRRSFDAQFCKDYDDKETLGDPGASQWTIRTAALNENSVVYSGGVGGDISFEIDLVKRFGVSVVVFDPSPIALLTMDKYSEFPEISRIDLVRFGLAAECREARFTQSNVPGELLLGNDDAGSSSLMCTTISAEMEKRGHRRIDLLKLDIEGFEYQVLQQCLSANLPIAQICVEFHHFLPNISLAQTLSLIFALRKRHFRLIHKIRHDMTFAVKD